MGKSVKLSTGVWRILRFDFIRLFAESTGGGEWRARVNPERQGRRPNREPGAPSRNHPRWAVLWITTMALGPLPGPPLCCRARRGRPLPCRPRPRAVAKRQRPKRSSRPPLARRRFDLSIDPRWLPQGWPSWSWRSPPRPMFSLPIARQHRLQTHPRRRDYPGPRVHLSLPRLSTHP